VRDLLLTDLMLEVGLLIAWLASPAQVQFGQEFPEVTEKL